MSNLTNKTIKTKQMQHDLFQMYLDLQNRYSQLSSLAATLTGTLSAIVKYDESLKYNSKIYIINLLVDEFSKDPDNESHQKWVSEWTELKQRLTKELMDNVAKEAHI